MLYRGWRFYFPAGNSLSLGNKKLSCWADSSSFFFPSSLLNKDIDLRCGGRRRRGRKMKEGKKKKKKKRIERKKKKSIMKLETASSPVFPARQRPGWHLYQLQVDGLPPHGAHNEPIHRP